MNKKRKQIVQLEIDNFKAKYCYGHDLPKVGEGLYRLLLNAVYCAGFVTGKIIGILKNVFGFKNRA